MLAACGDNEPEQVVKKPTSPKDTLKPAPIYTKSAYRLFYSNNLDQQIGVIDLTDFSNTIRLDNPKNNLGITLGISVNQRGQRLYITETDGARILRLSLADTSNFKLVYDSDNGVVNPTSVVVDTIAKRLYWADSGRGQIMQGELFGSKTVAPVALFGGAQVIANCLGLAIDGKKKEIYFCDNSLKKIMVGSLTGTDAPTPLFENFEKMGCPTSLVLTDDKIFWADDCTGSIISANRDGSGVPQIIFDAENDGISLPQGLDVDKKNGKIYWSDVDSYTIYRGTTDGSGIPEILVENIYANSISLELK